MKKDAISMKFEDENKRQNTKNEAQIKFVKEQAKNLQYLHTSTCEKFKDLM